ncbi:MAG: hypothetical protein B6I18_01610 [Bacteroidetes bacterium 4572_112]|nr:MAG: hypothetical protein B6I18_01610 [Bacteroidetes bacterium 4572_112]
MKGIIAFIIVLFTMPLGHAAMILMEKGFGHEHVFLAALLLGFFGLLLIIWGVISENDTKATFMGLFGGLFIWTGWVEFAYVYYAHRYGVDPLMANGEIITKPEYLIMPSSIGFWAVFMIYYFFGTKTGCSFFNWFQKAMNVKNVNEMKPTKRNTTISTFLELTLLLWTFYLVLLFAYDDNFFGDRSNTTYFIAFASLAWSLYLFIKLLKIKTIGYAIRYAIPTVIIFWNFVEILGRWDFFKEFWVEPHNYILELSLILIVFLGTLAYAIWDKKKAIN